MVCRGRPSPNVPPGRWYDPRFQPHARASAVTSLESARRVVRRLDRQGVAMTVDAMLNDGHGGHAKRIVGTPWEHRVPPNEGDCLKTAHIRLGDLPRAALALPKCGTAAACLAEVRTRRAQYCRGAPSAQQRGGRRLEQWL